MVAYSFAARFRAPILAGTKCQTIRADRKRHARPGEEVQLYTGIRTRQCAIIGRAVCEAVDTVTIAIDEGWISWTANLDHDLRDTEDMDAFARADGFTDWSDMRAFWRTEHPGVPVFSGVLIRWGALL